jgi:hypothetical protein
LKITELQLAGLVGGMLGAPSSLLTVAEIFEWAEKSCDLLNTPFNLVQDVRVVHERLPIVSDALKPTNSSKILPFLSETSDPVLLGADILRSGRDALYFFALADHDMLVEWVKQVNGKNRTQLLVGSSHNRMVIAASFSAFLTTP